MAMEEAGETTEQGAVIDTSPAMTEFNPTARSQVPERYLVTKVPVTVAAAAAMVVVVATWPARNMHSPAQRVDPGLNPYHPNHRMMTPRDASTKECPCMGFTVPSALKRPLRGPTTMAPTSPANPPTM